MDDLASIRCSHEAATLISSCAGFCVWRPRNGIQLLASCDCVGANADTIWLLGLEGRSDDYSTPSRKTRSEVTDVTVKLIWSE